jgi:hypothetical protein
VCRAGDEVAAVGLVDEQLGLDGFGDAQLDRLVARRRHQDRAADGERTAKLDPLDARVPLGPALDVRPEPPDGLGLRARLDAVLDGPHETHTRRDSGFGPHRKAEARTGWCSSKLRGGSDGTRTRDLRRDRPAFYRLSATRPTGGLTTALKCPGRSCGHSSSD